jgi:hypothetical protein
MEDRREITCLTAELAALKEENTRLHLALDEL